MVLVVSCLVELLVVLDASVVNVALPHIRGDLGFTAEGLTWVVNGYLLTFGGLLLLGGRVGDVLGPRRVLIAGMAVFAGASAIGGLAPSPAVLVAARLVQGAGAAVLAPVSLAILTTHHPDGPRRLRALGTWTAVAVAGGAVGNVVGGLLTEAASWRWVLLVNVPVGVVVVLLARRTLPVAAAGDGGRLDVRGALLATGAVALVTHALVTGTWVLLAVAAPILAAFAAVERRVAAPLLPGRLVRMRSVAAGNAVIFVAAFALMPMWFFLTLRMQDTLGYTPLQTGLGFVPVAVVTIGASMRIAPRLASRWDARLVVAGGALLAAAGFAWQARAPTDTGYAAAILGPAVALGLGGGVLNAPLTSIATTGVPDALAGAAAGLVNATKQVGAVLGLAVITLLAGTNGGAFALMAASMVAVALLTVLLPGGVRRARAPR